MSNSDAGQFIEPVPAPNYGADDLAQGNPTPTNTSLREEIQQILASYRVRLNTPAFEVADAAWKAKENNSKIDHATIYATAAIEALLTAKITEARIDEVEMWSETMPKLWITARMKYPNGYTDPAEQRCADGHNRVVRDIEKYSADRLKQLQHPTKETETTN